MAAPTDSRRAIGGWILFDWAAQPYFTLVLTFVYAPYFASVLAADPVRGQADWGYAAAAAGLIVALLGPALGAIADASGARKPWIALFSALLVVGCFPMELWETNDPIPATSCANTSSDTC